MAKHPLTKEELTAQLKALAAVEIPEESIHMGAMCYSPALPQEHKVRCQSCGMEVEVREWESEYEEIRGYVRCIVSMGYDAKVERLCADCVSKKGLLDEDGEMFTHGLHTVFYFKTKEQQDYVTSVSDSPEDYKAVLEFLRNNPTFTDYYDATVLIKDCQDVIKRMTGISID